MRRCVGVDKIVVAEFPCLDVGQVDGLNSPAVAPLDCLTSGPWARSCFCLVAWKDSVTRFSKHRSVSVSFMYIDVDLLLYLFELVTFIQNS